MSCTGPWRTHGSVAGSSMRGSPIGNTDVSVARVHEVAPGIVRAQGGSIAIDSRLREDAPFTLTLPRQKLPGEVS
jgi:hypothetical protein